MSLLLLTDSGNFFRRRREIICAALDLHHPESKQACLKEYLSVLAGGSLRKASRRKKILEIPDSLYGQLSSGEISPYEAVGILKENNKKDLTGSEMKKIWTYLSIIDGLDALGDNSLGGDSHWDERIKKDSTIPKLERLAHSLDGQEAFKGHKYVENYSHLKESRSSNTNWGEVVSAISPQLGGLIKSLLSATPESLDKKEIIEAYFWPKRSQGDIENRRLNNFLRALGNRPTGRKRRYEAIVLNLEPECFVADLPEVPSSKPSLKEYQRSMELVAQVSELLDRKEISHGSGYGYKNKLGRLKTTNLPQTQELWKRCEGLLGNSYSLDFPTNIDPSASVNQEHLPHKIKEVFRSIENLGNSLGEHKLRDYNRFLLADLLVFVEDREGFIDKHVRGTELEGDPIIKQWMDKTLYNQTRVFVGNSASEYKPLVGTRVSEMLLALRQGHKFDFSKSYHPEGLTSLHISSLVGVPQEVKAICHYYSRGGLSLFPKTKMARTPIDMSTEENTKVLLAHIDFTDVKSCGSSVLGAGVGHLNYGHFQRDLIEKAVKLKKSVKEVKGALKKAEGSLVGGEEFEIL
jgi:hypothetical protein